MKIKCYNYGENGTWIIDTEKEYSKALKSETKYNNIIEYNNAVLEDLSARINEKIMSKYEIIEK